MSSRIGIAVFCCILAGCFHPPSGLEQEKDEGEGVGGVLDARGADAGAIVVTSSSTVCAPLPYRIHESAAYFDGSKLWYLGGCTDNNAKRTSIHSFDPQTCALAQSAAAIPVGQHGAYFAAKGSVIYMFGGDTGFGLLRSIVRFDSSTQTVTTMSAQLPTARYQGGAVWAGDSIYLVGGWDGLNVLSEVLRYDPLTDTIVKLRSDPRLQREMPAVFALGGYIYIAGGFIQQAPERSNSTVIRFDPATSSLTTLPAENPIPHLFTGYGSDGTYGYLFGGVRSGASGANAPMPEIMRFDPTRMRIDLVGNVAIAKHGNAWTWANGSFYTFGGMTAPAWTWYDSIQRWTPPAP